MIGCRSATLIGLCGEIEAAASIGDMIAQMDRIRRRHNVVLTRLILGIDDAVSVAEIDESVDNACATLCFPRPVIVMAA